MNPIIRFDAAIARHAIAQNSGMTMDKLMPWPKQDDELNLLDAMRNWN